MSHDAIVVGSGPNGLAAAITLARAGWAVTVLETAVRPGGAVRSEALTLPGFVHDTFSAVYPAAAASPVFERYPLEEHGLRWVQPEACYAHPLPDGEGAALYRDLDRTVESLESLGAGQGEAWGRFAVPYVRHFDAFRRTMLSGFPPLRGPLRLTAALGVRGLLRFARLVLRPASSFGHELFSVSGARAWLYGSAMHNDVPPTGAGSAVAAAYLNLLGHGAGWPSPEGGAGRLSKALVSYLHSLGGRVRTETEVVEILTRRGRAVGVRLAGGEALRSRRGGRRRDARRAGPPGRRLTAHALCPGTPSLPPGTVHGEGRLGAQRTDPLELSAGSGRRDRSRRAVTRTSSCRPPPRREASRDGPSCSSASSRSPTPAGRRRVSTRPGPIHGGLKPRTGGWRQARLWSGWRARSSASHRAFVS